MLTMRDEHDPGDQGFDPWNFAEIFGTEEKMRWEWSFDFRPGKRYPIVKRVNTVIDDNFTLMRTRELNNGRLAMIAMMAIFTQVSESVSKKSDVHDEKTEYHVCSHVEINLIILIRWYSSPDCAPVLLKRSRSSAKDSTTIIFT